MMISTKSATFELTTIPRDEHGQFIMPEHSIGIVPFYINEQHEMIWGCVETNRCGLNISMPPVGSPDIIVNKGLEQFRLELNKPIPENITDLKEFFGSKLCKAVFDRVMQKLEASGYQLYIENPLDTAARETYEEHGCDLRKPLGKNRGNLKALFGFPIQHIQSHNKMVAIQCFTALIDNPQAVDLKTTHKQEEKIANRIGHTFYETGTWMSLTALKQKLSTLSGASDNLEQERAVMHSRIQLIEKMEASIAMHLIACGHHIQSNASVALLPFQILKYDCLRDPHEHTPLILSNTNGSSRQPFMQEWDERMSKTSKKSTKPSLMI